MLSATPSLMSPAATAPPCAHHQPAPHNHDHESILLNVLPRRQAALQQRSAGQQCWMCKFSNSSRGMAHHAAGPNLRTSSSGPPDGGVAASAGAMVDRRERRGATNGSPPAPGAASPLTVISPLGRCRPGSAAVAKALAALPAVQELPSGPPAGSRASAPSASPSFC